MALYAGVLKLKKEVKLQVYKGMFLLILFLPQMKILQYINFFYIFKIIAIVNFFIFKTE